LCRLSEGVALWSYYRLHILPCDDRIVPCILPSSKGVHVLDGDARHTTQAIEVQRCDVALGTDLHRLGWHRGHAHIRQVSSGQGRRLIGHERDPIGTREHRSRCHRLRVGNGVVEGQAPLRLLCLRVPVSGGRHSLREGMALDGQKTGAHLRSARIRSASDRGDRHAGVQALLRGGQRDRGSGRDARQPRDHRTQARRIGRQQDTERDTEQDDADAKRPGDQERERTLSTGGDHR